MAQQSKQNQKHSEEEYFQKADNLIHYSCPVLRSIFYKRWEQTTGNPWNETSANDFISGMGKDFFKHAISIQKEWLKSGKVEEWDMTLLCNLLKQIKWKVEDEESIFQHKKENQAVEKLGKERNKAAHNSMKKLNDKGYNEVEEVVCSQLAELGLSETEIASIVQKAGVLTSASGWAIAKKILHKGNKKFKMGNYSRAIELYSEAMQVPNLLQCKQAILLEKRATACVALVEGMEQGPEKTMHIKEAMLDVTKSMEFGDDSWNAHQIIGKIYRQRSEFDMAIEHFKRALELSPGQSEVKAELDRCKLVWGRFELIGGPKVKTSGDENNPSGIDLNKQSESRNEEKAVLKTVLIGNSRWTGIAKNVDMNDLKQRADGGSITAHRLLQGLRRQVQFEESWGSGPPFTEDQTMQLVDDLHFYITNADWSAEIESTLRLEVAQYMEALLRIHGHNKGELDRKLRICYVWRRGDLPRNIEVLKVGLERYPDDVYYYTFLSFMYTYAGDPEAALETACRGLQVFPDHVELLFDKAYLTEFIFDNGGNFVEVKFSSSAVTMETPNIHGLYLRFIERAPRDHFNVPEAYYAIAAWSISTKNLEMILAYYHRGLEYEKYQLPCHLPYECNSKRIVERAIKEMRPKCSKSATETVVETEEVAASTTPSNMPPTFSKLFSDDVWKVELIKAYRGKFNHCKCKVVLQKIPKIVKIKEEPHPKNTLALEGLKPMKMIDIDDTKDRHVYMGCLIFLTLTEDPIVGAFNPIHSLARDENGEVIRIYFHNMTHDSKAEKQLSFGRKLTVINPFVRLNFNDRRPYIQVDDPASIIYKDEVVSMCRYCGKENAPHNCARCKWAKYCSRECQEKDWKTFGHKIICMQK